ncbi:glucose dehydrogenase [Cereibacter changlensis JA139]|uniref:Glucose dehydrogenase n=2 Tax=Cereibacter changlensis TaxID=402884 RepID=A0A2T4JZ98_9RHOB|nr:SDR family oxidoreductase [Cereibacter changlensis]PTE23228.1 glucose dehydrogenase [Cereibacter changlensis JA139]PZX49050.1 ribitol 2-dehydrogenase [Cereibacter changlensis]
MSQDLHGKVAAITGAASGIGLAATRALLAAGARVVLVDRNADALAGLTSELGPNAVAQVTDLLDADSCNAMVPEILEKVGQIDILICNAGSYIGGDLVDTNPAAIDRMLNLNVNAVMKNVHAVAPHMTARGSGDIIVTSSIAGHAPIHVEPVYSASKWAVTCFVQTMRRQLMGQGVRVGQVSPGPVISALLADWEPDRLQRMKDAGALMEPVEVADALMYMLTRPRNVTIRDMIVLPSNFDV